MVVPLLFVVLIAVDDCMCWPNYTKECELRYPPLMCRVWSPGKRECLIPMDRDHCDPYENSLNQSEIDKINKP